MRIFTGNKHKDVIPAKAGTHSAACAETEIDSGFRRNDGVLVMSLLVIILLSACATVESYHNACLEQNNRIADQVACIKANVAADEYMRGDTLVREYIKTGEVLVEKVANGQMTEREAQLRLVEKLNDMRGQELRNQAYQAEIHRNSFSRETRCRQDGAHIYCSEY